MVKLFKKMELKKGIILCSLGLVIIGIGALKEQYLTIRLAGVIVVTGGMVTIGKRFYEAYQKKMKEKKEKEHKEFVARL